MITINECAKFDEVGIDSWTDRGPGRHPTARNYCVPDSGVKAIVLPAYHVCRSTGCRGDLIGQTYIHDELFRHGRKIEQFKTGYVSGAPARRRIKCVFSKQQVKTTAG